jgi:hypothetical protein
VLKFVYLLKEQISVKNKRKTSFIGDIIVLYGLQNNKLKKLAVPTKRVTVLLITVKSSNPL